MKILVISDSHGAYENIVSAIKQNKDIEAVFFLGDGERDLENALAECDIFPYGDYKGIEIYQVCGNCDIRSTEAVTLTPVIEGHKLLITHGFSQHVKYGLDKLKNEAEQKKCCVAIYGHTHIEHLYSCDGIILFNPGSIRNGSYGILKVNDEELEFEHRNLFTAF